MTVAAEREKAGHGYAAYVPILPAQNRGRANAMPVLGQTVIGFGFGALIAHALSDLLAPILRTASLRYAMRLAPLVVAIAWFCASAGWRQLDRETK